MKQKPAFVLDLRLQPGSFDINITPDKREVLLVNVRADCPKRSSKPRLTRSLLAARRKGRCWRRCEQVCTSCGRLPAAGCKWGRCSPPSPPSGCLPAPKAHRPQRQPLRTCPEMMPRFRHCLPPCLATQMRRICPRPRSAPLLRAQRAGPQRPLSSQPFSSGGGCQRPARKPALLRHRRARPSALQSTPSRWRRQWAAARSGSAWLVCDCGSTWLLRRPRHQRRLRR